MLSIRYDLNQAIKALETFNKLSDPFYHPRHILHPSSLLDGQHSLNLLNDASIQIIVNTVKAARFIVVVAALHLHFAGSTFTCPTLMIDMHHYDQETLEFAWNFPTPSRFPGQSSAVIGTFWLGVAWELENPRRIPGIVPVAINPYLTVARFVRLDLFQWNSSDGG